VAAGSFSRGSLAIPPRGSSGRSLRQGAQGRRALEGSAGSGSGGYDRVAQRVSSDDGRMTPYGLQVGGRAWQSVLD